MTETHFYHGPLGAPKVDDADLVAMFGSKGYSDDVAPYQYAAWADGVGLIEFLAKEGAATLESISEYTALSEAGAEALVGVLACIGLVTRKEELISLSPLTEEYLVRGRPFYMGDSYYLTCTTPIPAFFIKINPKTGQRMALGGSQRVASEPRNPVGKWVKKTIKRVRGWEFGGHKILINQHSRNLPSTAAAAQLPLFEDVECLVDMAGGSGTFAIPLAQRFPNMRIILADLPQAAEEVKNYLEGYGVEHQVEFVGMDAFDHSWPVPECDAVFFGNFVHGFNRQKCLQLASNSMAKLRPGGKLIFHELVWNENKDGPLKTALFNVTMKAIGGKQRTVSELYSILEEAGFNNLFADRTSGGFCAVGGHKPLS